MVADKLSLIDTDALSYILKRKEPAYQNSLHYLQKFGGLKISCLSYYECRRGYQAIGATKRLQVFQDLLQITEVLYLNPPILEKAREVYSVLKIRVYLLVRRRWSMVLLWLPIMKNITNL